MKDKDASKSELSKLESCLAKGLPKRTAQAIEFYKKSGKKSPVSDSYTSKESDVDSDDY